MSENNGNEIVGVDRLQAQVAPVVARAAALVIVTPQDYEDAANFLKDIKTAQKQVDDTALRPLRESKAKIEETRKRFDELLMAPLKDAEGRTKDKMQDWDREQERIRKAEEDRLNAIEAERQRREREKAEAAARLAWEKAETARKAEEEARRKAQAETDAKAREAFLRDAEKSRAIAAAAEAKAAAKEEQAEFVPPPAQIHVASVAPRIKGQSTSVVWKARIVDPREALRAVMSWPDWSAYVKLDQTEFNKFASRTKGAVQVPGVEMYQESNLRSGGR